MKRQFPCILEGFYTYLAFDKDNAMPLDNNCIANIDEINFNDKIFKNITTEYLANTYGEVKSKEHAEFIVKLCENAGIDVFPQLFDANHFVFKGRLSFHNCEKITCSELKQITIPLPPECEGVDEWPKVGSSVEWGHTVKGEVKSLSDGFAWIKLDNKDYTTVYVSSLRKPKTPEQELRDFISLLWDENNHDFDMFLDIVTEHVIKKPQ